MCVLMCPDPDCRLLYDYGDDEFCNIYELTCPACQRVFCSKCENAPHFPAFCDDKLKWRDRGCETDPYLRMRLHGVQLRWDYYEQVIGWLQGFSEWCETTTGDDLLNYNNHAVFAIDELSTIASSMKWLHVHTCFNPALDPPLYSDFAILQRDFGRLLQMISNPINWGDLKHYRLQAIWSIKIILLTLIGARRNMRRQFNPAETAAESDLADERGNMENVRDLWDHRYFRG